MTTTAVETISSVDEGDGGEDTGLQDELIHSPEDITDPFDPEKVKIRTVNVLVAQLVSRIEHGGLDLAPDFQRLRGIWDNTRKSRLIESLLLRIPIPVFYVAADANDDWQVVDGLQRMSTINDFVTGEFVLNKLEYLTHLNGHTHDQLPRLMQRRIGETQLVVNVIEPGTPREVMFNVFLRINTGGMTLNNQEIRHALHPGVIRGYLIDLSESEEFLIATDYSIAKRRMADRECVLRFLAFYITSPKNYTTYDLDSFLGKTMDRVNNMSPEERGVIATDFKKAMRAAFAISGNDAFRIRHNREDKRRPINRALFEAWGVLLAHCSLEQVSQLVNHRKKLRYKFRQLMSQDIEFDRAISRSTGDPRNVRKRFHAIEQLLREVV